MNSKYTCKEYREEMLLNSLKQKLNNNDLNEEEKSILLNEIKKLETMMKLD